MKNFDAQQILRNIDQYGLSETEIELLKFMLVRTVVPMIIGTPGTGKSAIVHTIAKKLGFTLKIISLATCDEVDLGVMPKVDKNENGLYVAKSVYPEWCIEANEETNGTIILFEELNRARLEVTNAALTILNEKIVGRNLKLKNHVLMVATGNLGDEDGNHVHDFDIATKGRLIEIEHKPNIKDWRKSYGDEHVPRILVEYLQNHIDEFNPPINLNASIQINPRMWSQFASFLTFLAGVKHPSASKILDITKKYGSKYLGPASIKLVKVLGDYKIVTFDDIIQGKIADFKSIKRDNKSGILNLLKLDLINNLNKTALNNFLSFLKNCDDDEVIAIVIKLMEEKQAITSGSNFNTIYQNYKKLIDEVFERRINAY